MTCVDCGSENDVTIREDESGSSDPLCAACWYEFDNLHKRIYCDMQFGFYNPQPNYTVNDLWLQTGQLLAEISAQEVAFEEEETAREERLAIQAEPFSTDERAMAALERSERFPGEHDVARAWLKHSRTASHFQKIRTYGEDHDGIYP